MPTRIPIPLRFPGFRHGVACAAILFLGACSTWRGAVPLAGFDPVRLASKNFKVVGRFSGSNQATYILHLFGPARQALAEAAWADFERNAGLDGEHRAAMNLIVEEKFTVSPFHKTCTFIVSGLVLEFQAEPRAPAAFLLAGKKIPVAPSTRPKITSVCRFPGNDATLRDAVAGAFAPIGSEALGLDYLPAASLKEELADGRNFAEALSALYIRRVSVLVFTKVYDEGPAGLRCEIHAFETRRGREFWKGEVVAPDRARLAAALAPAVEAVRGRLSGPAGAALIRGQ